MFWGLKEVFLGPQKHKKLIFSKNPNSVICLNIGGSFHSGPGDLGTIGRLDTIHLIYDRLLASVMNEWYGYLP